MISTIAFRFITSSWGKYIIFSLTVLAALAGWGRSKRRQGATDERGRIVDDVQFRTERGKDAFHENQRQIDGLNSSVIANRLRRRDSHWVRMPDLR